MAGTSRSDSITNANLKGMEGLAQFFVNLAEGILDFEEIRVNHEIKAILHAIAVKHMPFTDKIDELSKAGSTIEDPAERKRFMDKLEEIEREGRQVKQGLDEVRRYVGKSGMSKEDQARLNKEIDQCEASLHNLYVANVPAYTYKQTMKLVNQNGFLRDVTALTLSNGNYALFYPAEHVEKMDKILETAALMYEQHPRPEAVKTEALMTSSIKSEAAVLRFENVSPELAERAVLEGGKYGFITMAKEERTDGSGQFDLICKAGETRAERDRNYREAIEIITKSAMSLCGPAAKIEAARMRHSAKEYDDLMEGLSEGGYVFSVHTKDVKVGEKRTQMIDVGEYVKFDQEKYRAYHDGIAEKMVVHRTEMDTRYDAMLYAAVQAGTGQKIYISNERMRELEAEAGKVFQELEGYLDGREAHERMDVFAELQKKGLELMQQRQAYQKQEQHGLSDAVSKELSENTAMIEALSVAGTGRITETIVLDRLVAAELGKHQFKYYAKGKDVAKEGEILRKAVDFCIRDTRKDAAKETENRLRKEIIGGGKDLSIGWEPLETELSRLDYTDFIAKEFARASADKESHALDAFTVSDVKKESDVLDREFDEAKREAARMLSGVRIRMQEVEIGMDAQTIETPAAARNARIYLANIQNMDRELTGAEAEERESMDDRGRTPGRSRNERTYTR